MGVRATDRARDRNATRAKIGRGAGGAVLPTTSSKSAAAIRSQTVGKAAKRSAATTADARLCDRGLVRATAFTRVGGRADRGGAASDERSNDATPRARTPTRL